MTSSMMPTVKWFFGLSLRQLIEDALDHGRGELFGRKSITSADDSRHDCQRERRRRRLVRQRPRPHPGTAVRRLRRALWCGPVRRSSSSSPASASTNAVLSNGRYSRTITAPTFSPCAFRYSIVSWTVSAPEPIRTMTSLRIRRADIVEQVILAAGELCELDPSLPARCPGTRRRTG